MSALVSLRGVSVVLGGEGGTRALDGVDLELGASECVAVVGPSGAGKSTLGHTVLGLLPPGARFEGDLSLDGRELARAPEASWREIRGRMVAWVPQEPLTALTPVRTVGGQLREVLGGASSWKARATALLAELGLRDPAARLRSYPFELSGGERQRVLWALALASEPRLLVADEPTSALDPVRRAELLALLVALRARRPCALLITTHDLAVARALADRVVVLDHGRVVESGPAASTLAAPTSEVLRRLTDLEESPR
jgi:peptide/nickel transport system ATP-binding protein